MIILGVIVVTDTAGASLGPNNVAVHIVEFGYVALLLTLIGFLLKFEFKLKRLDFDLQNNSSWA